MGSVMMPWLCRPTVLATSWAAELVARYWAFCWMPWATRQLLSHRRLLCAVPERKISISMKNLVLYSRKRAGKTMADRLSAEIMDAFNQQGAAFKRKEEMHRMAEANKAFAHFRF